MPDKFATHQPGLGSPANEAFAITPHDSNDFANNTRAIYVGTGGDIVAVIGGVAITFKNVPDAAVLPIRASRVNATNTTAQNMVGLL